MALWDICGRACGRAALAAPRRAAAARRRPTSTTSSRGTRREPRAPRSTTGLAPASTSSTSRSASTTRRISRLVRTLREALGAGPAPPRSTRTAAGRCRRLCGTCARSREHDIDFVEQPVRGHPIGQLGGAAHADGDPGLRERGALVGGRRLRAHPRSRRRTCTASRRTGSARSAAFTACAWVAEYEGLQVCKHTHGELGLAAAAGHHVVLTLPNGVDGHQQTAHLIEHDILTEPIPIADRPALGRDRRRRGSASRSTTRRRGGGGPLPRARASTCRGRTTSSQKEER